MWRGGRRHEKRAREEEEEAGQERGKRRGGGRRGQGRRRGRQAGQPQPRADADGWGLRVATAAAVCAAAGAEGTRNGRGLYGGGSGRAGPLREVGGEDEGKAGEEGSPPLQPADRQGKEAKGKGPEMDEGRWRRMLGEALPGVSLHCPQEKGRKPRVRMLRELLQREGWYGADA